MPPSTFDTTDNLWALRVPEFAWESTPLSPSRSRSHPASLHSSSPSITDVKASIGDSLIGNSIIDGNISFAVGFLLVLILLGSLLGIYVTRRHSRFADFFKSSSASSSVNPLPSEISCLQDIPEDGGDDHDEHNDHDDFLQHPFHRRSSALDPRPGAPLHLPRVRASLSGRGTPALSFSRTPTHFIG